MPAYDPRVDAYIEKCQPFAKPILEHLRETVHKVCPNVEETIKWGVPHFEYHGILCSMAGFKEHCVFVLWKASLLKDEKNLLQRIGKTEMTQFKKMTSLKDLPPDRTLKAYIEEAMYLNEQQLKAPSKPKQKILKEVVVPDDLSAALKKNKAAGSTFANFSPSHQREYIEWINEAKTEATRNKRLTTTIEWLMEGKARNWKYMK